MQSNRHTPMRARKVEIKYGRQLRQIASYIDSIVKGFDVNDETVYPAIATALRRYAASLDVWAHSAAGRVLTDIALRDEKTWMIYAKDMSKGMRDQIRNSDIGAVYQQLLAEQVALIKSLPLDAANRVHDLATRALIEGNRSSEIAGLIMATGRVTRSRANTIARTEVSRASTLFTEVRAKSIGSKGYIWRDSEDGDVRHDHHLLNGEFIPWDSPPIVDRKRGIRAHAGCIYNCRCYPEPVIPE
ncbi:MULTISPECIES: phage minor head protein [unclassified Acinetobacter]|uniref:phage head morphogenesis protein n=1 Tax=unclassified Acinetobacter TaxID=196816 RepID=UPI00244A0067|nr:MULTISPECIES: phage minor head protein [unclassified Acinetobacter]MDH0030328.1 minor capsid protein [Acinetobacter sp. GD04021]MDH0885896.1 minor capsid protein [Acinetobacter sp. GD03873]MDH1082516.1 minor capsid protein [Acinetobacter sp. GD03983]MDH2189092.1 minor capsid protein [Acinetobacter sp. GD03645]MDH2202280.1 minor capsid protein [Acinetobacter sp. GD03647]